MCAGCKLCDLENIINNNDFVFLNFERGIGHIRNSVLTLLAVSNQYESNPSPRRPDEKEKWFEGFGGIFMTH